MSVPNPCRSIPFRRTAYALVAILIASLQIGLPWYLISLGKVPVPSRFSPKGTVESDNFWKQRLRFDGLFKPIPDSQIRTDCLSAAIHQDELIALFSDATSSAGEGRSAHVAAAVSERQRSERQLRVVRFNLKTGSIRSTRAPAGVRHIISDGTTLWLMPAYKNSLSPFLWNGRPTALASSEVDPSLCQLVQYMDGRWQFIDSFALLPDCFDGEGEPLIRVSSVRQQILITFRLQKTLYYQPGLAVVTQAEARAYRDLHSTYLTQMNRDEISGMGWTAYERDNDGNRYSFWTEGTHLCSLDFVVSRTRQPTSGLKSASEFGFVCCCSGNPETNDYVDSPIHWDRVHHLQGSRWDKPDFRPQLRAVSSVDGRLYVMFLDRTDGRIVVMQLLDREFQTVAQTASPYVGMICLDGSSFLIVTVILPTFILGLWARWRQCRQAEGTYQFALETVSLASLPRRACARLVDLSIIGSLFLTSVIIHPEFVSWWRCVITPNPRLGLLPFGKAPKWTLFNRQLTEWQDLPAAAVSAPFVTWMFILASTVLVGQIIWQGWTGHTIGKWLLGIRVLKTTLRPCGFARSLLREILLGVDGIFLVSWIPGIFSILLTTNRQRIGDRIAETIVVRARKLPTE